MPGALPGFFVLLPAAFCKGHLPFDGLLVFYIVVIHRQGDSHILKAEFLMPEIVKTVDQRIHFIVYCYGYKHIFTRMAVHKPARHVREISGAAG